MAKAKGFEVRGESRFITTDFGEVLCEDRMVHSVHGNLVWESEILLSAGRPVKIKRLPTGRKYQQLIEKNGQLRLI